MVLVFCLFTTPLLHGEDWREGRRTEKTVTALDSKTFVVVTDFIIPGTSSVELFRIMDGKIILLDVVFIKNDGSIATYRRIPVRKDVK